MKLTDKEAKRQLKIAKSTELDERVFTFPENERDGKSDIEILRDEAEYLLELFEEGGTIFSDDLEYARDILRETKNGKEFPMLPDGRIHPSYTPMKVQNAKEIINEYRRIKNLVARLRKL